MGAWIEISLVSRIKNGMIYIRNVYS